MLPCMAAAAASHIRKGLAEMKKLLVFVVLSLVCAFPALAGDVKVKVAVAVDGNTRPATVFAASVPRLYAYFLTEGTEKGDKIRGVWIAEDTNGAAPANYKIDEATLTSEKDDSSGAFSLSKPNNGWPVGKYRVDVYVDGELEATTKFQIK
jgi:outer membrane usher protein FimD/PapC